MKPDDRLVPKNEGRIVQLRPHMNFGVDIAFSNLAFISDFSLQPVLFLVLSRNPLKCSAWRTTGELFLPAGTQFRYFQRVICSLIFCVDPMALFL